MWRAARAVAARDRAHLLVRAGEEEEAAVLEATAVD
jgi:hypothetical protein